MFCFLSLGETKLEANNVLPLKVTQLLHSHFLVGCKPVVSLVMKEHEGTAELVRDPGIRALEWKAAFSEVLDELYKRPCGTCDCTGKSHFNKESTRTSFFISTHSEAIQRDNKMLYLQLDKLYPDLTCSS